MSASQSSNNGLAITLTVRPYQERHQIVTALTAEWGKVTALARNSIQSRRFGGCLHPFTASLWQLTPPKPGSEFYRLDGAEFKYAYHKISQEFERLALASTLNEWVLRTAQPELSAHKLFQLHCNALTVVENFEVGSEKWIGFLNVYLFKLTQWLGSQPRLHACLGCHTTLDRFSEDHLLTGRVEEGGWICKACRSSGKFSLNTTQFVEFPAVAVMDCVLCLQHPIKGCLERLSASGNQHRELFPFLERFLAFHNPGFDYQPVKSLRFLGLGSESSPRHQTKSRL